ncbi:MAG: APC family permease [Chloroflexota bacterium]
MAGTTMDRAAPGRKGLKADAVGFANGVVIGVASTAPAYSLAASLGIVVVAVGLQSPAIMLLAFLPMGAIAAAYYYLNRVDPDCGTSFTWVTRAMGPWLGWLTGWAIIVADVIVMANLAEIAAVYTFLLFGIDTYSMADPVFTFTLGDFTILVTVGDAIIMVAGALWIAAMTWISYIGIELSARVQFVLLAVEMVTLALFTVVALAAVYGLTGAVPEGSVQPSLDWLNPFAIVAQDAPDAGFSYTALAAGLVAAIFIYWGWDSTVSVNEESKDPYRGPGKAALVSTVVLLLTFVLVSIAAQAFHGPQFLADAAESEDVLGALGKDVLGDPLYLLLIASILTSAAASTLTTILPTARTALSMADHDAIPKYWGRTHPRFLSPSTATIGMGVFSIVFYLALRTVSANVLYDAIAALGIMIAFYYGLTGFASAIFFRKLLTQNVRHLLFVGVIPVLGGLVLMWALVQSIIDLSDPANTYTGSSWFGFGPPVVIAAFFTVMGLVLMLAQRAYRPAFFRHHLEAAPRDALDIKPPSELADGPGAIA